MFPKRCFSRRLTLPATCALHRRFSLADSQPASSPPSLDRFSAAPRQATMPCHFIVCRSISILQRLKPRQNNQILLFSSQKRGLSQFFSPHMGLNYAINYDIYGKLWGRGRGRRAGGLTRLPGDLIISLSLENKNNPPEVLHLEMRLVFLYTSN